jgi:hypothetical protein
MASSRFRIPALSEQHVLDNVQLHLLAPADTLLRERFRELMEQHHYLKSDTLVGEQLRYVAEVDGRWVALLSWSAAANHLKDREQWIGWNISQRRRRLALVANNSRYLILPGPDCPNLASRVLALCCDRLADDWQQAYGHPVLVAESFVDSQLFRGTCYKAQGWKLLGETQGSGRSRQDYYTAHGRPKQLWVRELRPKARAVLRAPSSCPPTSSTSKTRSFPVVMRPSVSSASSWSCAARFRIGGRKKAATTRCIACWPSWSWPLYQASCAANAI